MSLRRLPALFALLALSMPLARTEDYTGPRPAMKDMLYLVHADNLIPTESGDAKQDPKHDDSFSVPGAASTAKTPLAEPIFLIQSDKISANSLELYKFDVKNGHREVTVGKRRGGKPFYLSVTKLDRGLFRVEASEVLENGEYAITPAGSNQVFCFEVY